MIEKVLAEKIRQYAPAGPLEQEQVLAELMQHFILAGLARAGFFHQAEFHGGTCLRIVHGLDRFSENLDFVLKEPDPDFAWGRYLDDLVRYLAAEGLQFEAMDKSDAETAVKKAFLKTDSFGTVLLVVLPHGRDARREVRIRLEVDTDPPAGSTFETSYIGFPIMTALTTQTLSSSFASKSHALLCREYVKGRDWYDFLWYCNHGVRPNLELLANALRQVGPWTDQEIDVNPSWYVARLHGAIARIDWRAAAGDVRRFLKPAVQQSLELWSSDLFGYHVKRLEQALSSD